MRTPVYSPPVTWRLELVQERGGWTRRVVAPDGSVFCQAWGGTPLDFSDEEALRMLAHQVNTAARSLFEAVAAAEGLAVSRRR